MYQKSLSMGQLCQLKIMLILILVLRAYGSRLRVIVFFNYIIYNYYLIVVRQYFFIVIITTYHINVLHKSYLCLTLPSKSHEYQYVVHLGQGQGSLVVRVQSVSKRSQSLMAILDITHKSYAINLIYNLTLFPVQN